MNFSSFQAIGLLPLLLPLTACTGNVDAPLAPDADASEVAAVIAIETTSYADPSTPPHTTAIARFIRTDVGAVDLPTLRMLGAALDLPATGTCAVVATHASGPRAVELVDVGAVTIESASRVSILAARRVPDVTDLVSGVVYASRADGAEALVSGPISLRIAGNHDIGPLALDIADVQAPEDLAFDGRIPDPLAPLAFSGNADIRVTWTAPLAPNDDVITFEIASTDESLVCSFADDGVATLPGAVFASSPGALTVHRIHREPLVGHGLDDGEARVDVARVYDFAAP